MVDSLSSFASGSSASGINFSGVASGLDTSSIIAALTQLEMKPVNAAKAKQTKLNGLQTLVGQLATKLKNLRDKAAVLTTLGQGLSLSATSSDTTKIVASASPSAGTGNHSIEVTQLAQAASSYAVGGATITDPAAQQANTGNITITYAGTPTAVDVTNKSLNEIRDAINDNVDGVTASVVNVGDSSNPNYRLVVTGEDTGASKTLTFSTDPGVSLSFTSITAAKNSIFSVDGITGIQRSTNTVSDYLEGTTLTFLAPTESGKPVTLTVSTDVSGVKSKIKGFVDAYNEVASLYNAQNTYNSTTKVAGAFFGDTSVSSVISQMRSLVFNGGSEYSSHENYTSLSAIGISVQGDGTLQIDDSKLTTALGTDVKSVLGIFADTDGTGADKGIAIEFRDFATNATTGGTFENGGAFTGILDAKTTAIKSQIASLQKTIDNGEERVAKFTKTLKDKYTKFEEAMGKLKAQQSALFAKFG
ncbi:MAG: flagellar filament capping protein FliD [Planctomycetota bacterium]